MIEPDAASGGEGRHGGGLWHDEQVATAVDEAGHPRHEPLVEEVRARPVAVAGGPVNRGRAAALQVAGLEFDEVYDCKRVTAPSEGVSEAALRAFYELSVRLAEGLGLCGLMDVEVMVAPDGPRVLEIDARLPSQTPTAVLWSSGLNILQAYADMVCRGGLPAAPAAARRACVYQHVQARTGDFACWASTSWARRAAGARARFLRRG